MSDWKYTFDLHRCHAGNGRGHAPDSEKETLASMVVRLSIPGENEHGGPRPHPNYGDQLQNQGELGRVFPEGDAVIAWSEHEERLADGPAWPCAPRSWDFPIWLTDRSARTLRRRCASRPRYSVRDCSMQFQKMQCSTSQAGNRSSASTEGRTLSGTWRSKQWHLAASAGKPTNPASASRMRLRS